jgi:hypothetical protein
MDPLNRIRVAGNSAQHIFSRPVRNVFVHPQLSPFLVAQKFLVHCGECEGRFSKLKDLPALEHFAVRSAPCGVLFRTDPSTG